MRKEYESMTANSAIKYKSIESITFHPLNKISLNKVQKKGEKKYWKFLGLIPIFPYTYKEDKYSTSSNSINNDFGISTIEELKNRIKLSGWYNERYFINENNELYYKAIVEIKYVNYSKDIDIHRFETNANAIAFYDMVKEKCEENDNRLT